nr:hypothetical protein [Aminiphilus sp.]
MKRELENFFLSLGKRFRKLEASKMSRLCEERKKSGFCNASPRETIRYFLTRREYVVPAGIFQYGFMSVFRAFPGVCCSLSAEHMVWGNESRAAQWKESLFLP